MLAAVEAVKEAATANKHKGKKAAPAIQHKIKKKGNAKAPAIQGQHECSLAYDSDELLLLRKDFVTVSHIMKQGTDKNANRF
jgi:hypothetical protein